MTNDKTDKPLVIKHVRYQDDIINGLQRSYRTGENCDLHLLVKGKILLCHKAVLSALSDTFAKSISTETSYIPIIGADIDIVTQLLELIYFGKTNIAPNKVMAVCQVALDLGLTSVIKGIQEYSKNQQSNLSDSKNGGEEVISLEEEIALKRINADVEEANNNNNKRLKTSEKKQSLGGGESLAALPKENETREKYDREPEVSDKLINLETAKNLDMDTTKKIMKESCDRKREEREEKDRRMKEERRREAEILRKEAERKKEDDRQREEKHRNDEKRRDEEKRRNEERIKREEEIKRKSVVSDENGSDFISCKVCQRNCKPGHSHVKLKNWSPDVRTCDQPQCGGRQFKFMRALIDHYSQAHKIDPCYTN